MLMYSFPSTLTFFFSELLAEEIDDIIRDGRTLDLKLDMGYRSRMKFDHRRAK